MVDVDVEGELVSVPGADVDRAKAFHADRLGVTADVDVRPADGLRVVQLTPPGSACSIGFGTEVPVHAAGPGSVRGLHLVVADIVAARAELVVRGVEVAGGWLAEEVRTTGGTAMTAPVSRSGASADLPRCTATTDRLRDLIAGRCTEFGR